MTLRLPTREVGGATLLDLERKSVDSAAARASSSRQLTKEATMKYLLLVCWDKDSMDGQDEPDSPPGDQGFWWVDELRERGKWLIGDQLAPPRRARTIRVRGGRTLVTDGPFAETKEAVGGFDLLECDSLEEAVELAATHPLAQTGAIEVRPLWGH
jgi:hypothetical protein